jgi:hypothetical protein
MERVVDCEWRLERVDSFLGVHVLRTRDVTERDSISALSAIGL